MISPAYAALWIFVFVLPWESILVIVPGVGIISRITGMLALVSAVAVAVISGRLRRWHGFHVAALLFVIWIALGLLFAYSGEALPSKFWTFVQLFLMVWMIWELAASRGRQRGLLVAYVLGAYFAALATIMVYRREAGALRRYSAGGVDANDLAMTLALALPIAWYLGMIYSRPLLRWVCRGYVPVGLLAIGLTGSRGGMVATVVALLIVPLTMTRLSPGRRAAAITLLVVSGVLAMAYVPDQIVERLATTATEVESADLHGRVDIWKAGMKAFAQKPLTGYGIAGFKSAARPWLGERRAAHNSYLSVLVEEGLVGFLLYSAMFVAVLASVLNLPTVERRFGIVLLGTVGVALLPLSWEDRKAVWFVLAALLGLSQAQVAWPRPVAQYLHPRSAPIGGLPGRKRPREPMDAPTRDAYRDVTV